MTAVLAIALGLVSAAEGLQAAEKLRSAYPRIPTFGKEGLHDRMESLPAVFLTLRAAGCRFTAIDSEKDKCAVFLRVPFSLLSGDEDYRIAEHILCIDWNGSTAWLDS